jgi:hypothetical protein
VRQKPETQVPFDFDEGRLSTPFATVTQDDSIYERKVGAGTPGDRGATAQPREGVANEELLANCRRVARNRSANAGT